MYLDYSFSKLFSLLLESIINYKIFLMIILSSVVFTVLYLINKNNKYFDNIVKVFNIVLIFIIIMFYKDKLFYLSIFNNFTHNMYFYFFNTIIYLCIITFNLSKNVYKKINIIFYSISLIFILFALFMTHYLDNNHLVILGNIYPSIVIGNYIYFIYYVINLIFIFRFLTKRK